MSVSETMVREFFETHGFLVHQRRKYVGPASREDEEIDFYVSNPVPVTGDEPVPFVLAGADLARVERAMVMVRGWHTEVFTPTMLAAAPELFRFQDAEVIRQAAQFFGDRGGVRAIAIVPALPQAEEARAQSIELLRARGVEGVIPFPTVLAELIAWTEANRNYQKSDLLQIIRVFKNYGFFREAQLELFKPKRPAVRRPKGPDPAAPESP